MNDEYNELDVVEIVKDKPEVGLVKGQQGTILLVHNEQDYEIEVFDENGVPIFLETLSKDFFKPYRKFKIIKEND